MRGDPRDPTTLVLALTLGWAMWHHERAVKRWKEQERMRFGPRTYTAEQEKFIAETVANRGPLPGTPVDGSGPFGI